MVLLLKIDFSKWCVTKHITFAYDDIVSFVNMMCSGNYSPLKHVHKAHDDITDKTFKFNNYDALYRRAYELDAKLLNYDNVIGNPVSTAIHKLYINLSKNKKDPYIEHIMEKNKIRNSNSIDILFVHDIMLQLNILYFILSNTNMINKYRDIFLFDEKLVLFLTEIEHLTACVAKKERIELSINEYIGRWLTSMSSISDRIYIYKEHPVHYPNDIIEFDLNNDDTIEQIALRTEKKLSSLISKKVKVLDNNAYEQYTMFGIDMLLILDMLEHDESFNNSKRKKCKRMIKDMLLDVIDSKINYQYMIYDIDSFWVESVLRINIIC